MGELDFYANVEPLYHAMCHVNLAADNAFFWRDESGVLQCGMLDFGGSSFSNISTIMGLAWGMGEPEMLRDHWDDLTRAFLEGLHEGGSFAEVKFEDLSTAIRMSYAQQSVYLGGGQVMQLYKIYPKDEWAKIKSRMDPKVNDAFLPRNYVRMIENALGNWKDQKLYDHFKRWKQDNSWWRPKRKPFVPPVLEQKD